MDDAQSVKYLTNLEHVEALCEQEKERYHMYRERGYGWCCIFYGTLQYIEKNQLKLMQ